jgi:hypothetical protein
MAILYRAIWTEDRSDLPTVVFDAFRLWVDGKSDGQLDVPESGKSSGQSFTWDGHPARGGKKVQHPAEVDVEWTRQGEAVVLRTAFVEHKPDGSRWATTVRSWKGLNAANGEPQAWVWVDVAAVAEESLDRVVIAAPALVQTMLEEGENPRRRCVSLSTTASKCSGAEEAETLAELLTDPERDLPVIVFADFGAVHGGSTGTVPISAAMRQAARKGAGIAAVYSVDTGARDALGDILGREFTLADAAFRIFLPGLDPARSRDDWRHRQTPPERYLRYPSTAATLILRAIGPSSAARRAPKSYEDARRLLEANGQQNVADWQALLDLADEQNAAHRTQLALNEDRYVELLSEFEDSQSRVASLLESEGAARVDLERALRLLRQGGLEDDYWSAKASDPHTEVPSQANSPSEAVELAREHLAEFLRIPDAACVDIEDIDAAIESRAWGQTSWEGFRALAAYAEARRTRTFEGAFWNWCESGHPLAWRASSKKLSMVESESLRKDKVLWTKRMLPVDTSVDSSGRVRMEAHLKIAEGGGNLAPRVYFFFKDADSTMHVGYYGPHRNMPNSKA